VTIDLTDRYNTSEYMAQFDRRGNRIDWTIDREEEPVLALMIHHTAGWYLGVTLDENSTEEQERAQIDEVAIDHFIRFDIGPGYHYFAFPSGRLYAVGKYGTHRAHTKGKNPETQNWWNRESMAICAFGDYQSNFVSVKLMRAIHDGIDEITAYAGELPLFGHREVPGNPTATQCPGDNLMLAIGATPPPSPPDPNVRVRELLKEALGLLGDD
jgi:hypothetical protein